MPTTRIIDFYDNTFDLSDNEFPAALIYFGERVPVQSWQELFFIAVKCLYTEFPDVISGLCSTDSTRNLFLRTNTIDMVSPRKIASIIYLETNRTPKQIVKAIRFILSRADVNNVQMSAEIFSTPYQMPTFNPQPQKQRRIQKPVLQLNQTIEEMLAALDAMEVAAPKSNVVLSHASTYGRIEPRVFGNLFFTLEGRRHGPFANEKNRYVALMHRLAELYPSQILKEAGHHINSEHRLTLMKGSSYLYFREPVELPNNLFIDKDFPDRVLVENERHYLSCCGLYFEEVMFGG